jgi:hypothetical protein
MSTREDRRRKRDDTKTADSLKNQLSAAKAADEVSEKVSKKTSQKKQAAKAADEKDVSAASFALASSASSSASTASLEIIDSIDYCDTNETHRQIVIVPKSGEQFWPTQNMAFFKTSGTSNEGTGWLSGTFYPTSGLTCKHGGTRDIIRNYEQCEKDNPGHFNGHIAKMSDYTSVREHRIITPYLFQFMTDLFDGVLRSTITQVFPGYPYKAIDDKMLSYPDFGSDIGDKYIFNLEKTIKNYFLTEDQLKLSYQLTPDNTGLWGFRFGDFSLSEFCRERWGPLPKFNVPPIELCRDNSDDVYDFIRENIANIEFDDMQSQVSQLLTPETKKKSNELFIRIITYVGNIRAYEAKYKQFLNKGKGKGKGKGKSKAKTKTKNNKTKNRKVRKQSRKK